MIEHQHDFVASAGSAGCSAWGRHRNSPTAGSVLRARGNMQYKPLHLPNSHGIYDPPQRDLCQAEFPICFATSRSTSYHASIRDNRDEKEGGFRFRRSVANSSSFALQSNMVYLMCRQFPQFSQQHPTLELLRPLFTVSWGKFAPLYVDRNCRMAGVPKPKKRERNWNHPAEEKISTCSGSEKH